MNASLEFAASLERTRDAAAQRLLAERGDRMHWTGELSSSALSTATACAALTRAAELVPSESERYARLAAGGRGWLVANQNDDGGFGDTTDSPSNPSTSALAWMALGMVRTGASADEARALERVEDWLRAEFGALDARTLARGLEAIYGDDKTFAVPILAACAMAGAFEGDPSAWESVPRLPYEIAVLPRGLFARVGMPVVSYALPALIAIGQAVHAHRRRPNPVSSLLRNASRERTLRVLESIQPENGGFLEATPLTSFVTLSLLSIGRAEHPVTRRGLAFLVESVRADGSWPIDTNLATWVSTLAVQALAGGGRLKRWISDEERVQLLRWIAEQQFRDTHPYTGAAPGGWAWTDLPGGVPDADDTPSALLALAALGDGPAGTGSLRPFANAGAGWLLDLQNADGGIPTFCRGFGKLPFDKSSADLTAHALRAWAAWEHLLPPSSTARVARARSAATGFLVDTQRADGAWLPLWFGSQLEPSMGNPLYGTSRVVRVRPDAGDTRWNESLGRGVRWLLDAQDASGGFGAAPGIAPTIEETALALEALADVAPANVAPRGEVVQAMRGAAEWLVRETDEGRAFEPAPIGLYFAKLWYTERLYPLVFSVSALERSGGILAAESRS